MAVALDADATYAFDRTQSRANVYSIDTPPPTVSGSLHVGHVFSYTHTDIVARFSGCAARPCSIRWVGRQRPADRAAGAELLRRALRSVAAVRSAFQPPAKPPKPPLAVSRPNFVELCARSRVEDEKVSSISGAISGCRSTGR
jgi:valyl-tRNA synthetase